MVANINIGNNFNSNKILATITSTNFALSTYVYANYTKNIILGSNTVTYLSYFDGAIVQYVTPVNL